MVACRLVDSTAVPKKSEDMKQYFSVTFMAVSFIAVSTGLLILPGERIYYSLLAAGCVAIWLFIMGIDKRILELQAMYERLVAHGGYIKCEYCGALFTNSQWCSMCGECYRRAEEVDLD